MWDRLIWRIHYLLEDLGSLFGTATSSSRSDASASGAATSRIVEKIRKCFNINLPSSLRMCLFELFPLQFIYPTGAQSGRDLELLACFGFEYRKSKCSPLRGATHSLSARQDQRLFGKPGKLRRSFSVGDATQLMLSAQLVVGCAQLTRFVTHLV